jgi:hypothetical protein
LRVIFPIGAFFDGFPELFLFLILRMSEMNKSRFGLWSLPSILWLLAVKKKKLIAAPAAVPVAQSLSTLPACCCRSCRFCCDRRSYCCHRCSLCRCWRHGRYQNAASVAEDAAGAAGGCQKQPTQPKMPCEEMNSSNRF